MRLVEVVITEGADFSEPGWIRNVKICGLKSKNGREYRPEALRQALPLYDSAAIYVNHAAKGQRVRTAQERWGRIHNPRFVEGDGSRGDVQYLESHEMTPRILEDLKKGLGFFGLSHVIDGAGKTEKGTLMVGTISRVESVDLVSDPATVKSLREQAEAEPAADPFVAAVTSLLSQNMTKDDLLAKIGELYDTLKGEGGEGEGGPGEAAAAPAPASEQTVKALTEQVTKLAAEVAQLKAKPAPKYVKPASGQTRPAAISASEQTIPTDPHKRAAWLRSAR